MLNFPDSHRYAVALTGATRQPVLNVTVMVFVVLNATRVVGVTAAHADRVRGQRRTEEFCSTARMLMFRCVQMVQCSASLLSSRRRPGPTSAMGTGLRGCNPIAHTPKFIAPAKAGAQGK